MGAVQGHGGAVWWEGTRPVSRPLESPGVPLAGYKRLFRLTGPLYVVVGFLARLPLAMSQLGVLLLVAGTTDSYGAGGACAGALAIANAVGAPFWGNLADRTGQRPVVLVQSLAGAAALAVPLVTTHAGVPRAWAAVAIAAAGLLMPQVGPMAREIGRAHV